MYYVLVILITIIIVCSSLSSIKIKQLLETYSNSINKPKSPIKNILHTKDKDKEGSNLPKQIVKDNNSQTLNRYEIPSLPISEYSKSIVKINSQNVKFNWIKPFSSKSYESIGTGFLIDNDGTIATCSHVISSSIKVYISIPMDGQETYEATILGICPDIDVAILKCSKLKGNKFLKLGDSDNTKPNQQAIAIGYPLGQDKLKITSGIISGRQDGKFQIDTTINRGNSGGPLVNSKGEVIGINFSKIKNDNVENVGYAIPIKQFQLVYPLLKKQKITHIPKLGAMFQNFHKDMRRYIGNTKKKCKSGFYVRDIVKNGPFDNVDINSGDIICNFDNNKLDNYGEMNVDWNIEKVHLFDYMKRMKNNQKVKVTVWTPPNKLETKVITLTNPYTNGIRNYYPIFEKVDFEVFAGIVVMKLTYNHLGSLRHNNVLKYKNVKHRTDQLLVITTIFPGSYMKKLNILDAGDILETVNEKKVSTIKEYRKALQSYKTSNNEKFITLKAIDKYYCAVPLDIILREEVFLSEKHQYPLSKIYKTFKKKINY